MAHKPVQENASARDTSISVESKKQPTIQEKKAALREMSDNTKSPETPLLSKDKISTSDSSANKIAGIKRPNPSSPASPLTYTYVRRRLETEQGKANGSPVIKEEATKEKNVQNSQEAQVVLNLQNSKESQNLQDSQNLQISKDSQNLQHIYMGEVTKATKPQNGFKPDVSKTTKPQNGSHEEVSKTSKPQNEVNEATKQQNGSKDETREAMKPQNEIKGEAIEVTKLVSSSLTASQDWKERFIRLQAFLKNCDQSNQEDYIRSK